MYFYLLMNKDFIIIIIIIIIMLFCAVFIRISVRSAVFVPLYAPPLLYSRTSLIYEHQRDRTKCPLYRGVRIIEVGNV